MIDLQEIGSPIDLITLKNHLVKMEKLTEVGGVGYIASLTDGVPRLENVDSWAKIIKEASTLRRLTQVASSIGQWAQDATDPAIEVLDRAEAAIFAISNEQSRAGLIPIAQNLRSAFEEIEKLHENHGQITGVPSGLIDLDNLTNGFQKGDICILAARPSMGKTAFALNVGRFAAEATGEPVAIFSLEMSEKQLLQRMIYSEAQIDSRMVLRGQLRDSDWKKLAVAKGDLNKLPIHIDDTSFLTPLELRAKCRRLKSDKGLGLVIVDYLQLMGSGVKKENANQDVSFISRSLKGLAKELDVPVICLSQLSRGPERREDHRPQLQDLRDSGAIEQDADVVMFLYRECVYKPTDENQNIAEMIVAKQRNGPTDVVRMRFDRQFTKFQNLSLGGFNG
jgi:replicative DNA helicase